MVTTTGKKRIDYIDALRAFALFGVIMVHANLMYSFYNELNDFPYFSAIGNLCRKVVFWLFDDKSRTIFSTLFGISFYLILNNPAYTNRKFMWRCVLLMCFGLFDKLFSSGDILFWYGLNGILLSCLPVRKLHPRKLLIIAIVLFLLSLINLSFFLEASFPIRYPADTTLAQIMSYPMADTVVSDLLGRLCIDSTMTLSCFVFGFYLGKSGMINYISRYTDIRTCLLTAVLFVVSLAAFRLSNYHYIVWRFSVVAGAVALSLNFIRFFHHFQKSLMFMTRYGRLGLTNYSSQYIVGTMMIMYIAIPLKMSIEYVFLMGMAIYILQTVFAWYWTCHFRYGPLEWLWRMATNLRYEPLRTAASEPATRQKIAILTSGILPVPAVQGGAVENLVDFYLTYNERRKLYDITVYSVKHPETKQLPALSSDVNHYYYIDTSSIIAKIRRTFYRLSHKDEYYNYFIEYFFEQAFKHIRKQSYDCIILENRPGYAYKLSQRLSSKLVLHLHNDLLNNDSRLHTDILNSLHKILTVSDYIKSRVCSIGETEKVNTVHNGIDLQRFSPQYKCNINRENLGLSQNDFVLLFSGRVNKYKGISELIDAMLKLEDTSNIKLLVLGSSFFGDAINEDEFIKSLKSKTKVIAEKVSFTGFIPYTQMPNYLKLADVAIIPSIWDDPFPTTVLEAQAMGLPIITTCRGGIPEEVTEENAIMLETDEHFVENLAEAILDLYLHPEKRQKMAAASLERSKLFDKETYVKNFFKALEGI